MNTAIATITYFVPEPITGRPIRQRRELRRMKPVEVKDDKGRTIRYTHGIWENGRYVERLTTDEAKGALYTNQGGCPWDEINTGMI